MCGTKLTAEFPAEFRFWAFFMSEIPVDEASTIKRLKPRWRVRLRSWKWWLYGDVNSQPRKMPPKGFWFQVALAVLLWTFIAGHPWLTTWINRHPPEFSSLETIHGVVVRTGLKSPHLDLKLRTGEILGMEFPVFLNTYGSDSRIIKHLGMYNEGLLNCEAKVWFDVPKHTLWKRYRVWQIACDNINAEVSYAELANESRMGLGFYGAMAVLLPLLLCFYFIRYLRKCYER